MTKYIRQLRAPLALCVTFAAACTVKDAKSDSSLARDTALNRDLQLAGTDTAAQPQLRDVPAAPAGAAAAPAPAPAASTPMRTGTTPTTRPSTTARTAAPAPAPARTTTPRATTTPRTTTPTTTTTASGNTVTRNPAGSTAGGGVGTIASGTSLSLRSNARVCTNTYQPGQTFSATVANAVTGSNGATIPAGATVSLEVTQLKRSENVNDKIVMEFAVRSVSFGGRTYPVSGSVADASIERVRNQPQNKDVQKVVGGAVAGAVLGQILGKSTKSTVVGAAAGAAAGAGAAAATANYEGCLPDGGSLAVTLNSPLQVKIS
jgi:hypothetical protein